MTIIPFRYEAAGAFTQEPLRAISFYGAADLATGHDTYTNSIVFFGGMEEDNGVSGDEFFSGIVAATELPCMRQGAQTSPLRVS